MPFRFRQFNSFSNRYGPPERQLGFIEPRAPSHRASRDDLVKRRERKGRTPTNDPRCEGASGTFFCIEGGCSIPQVCQIWHQRDLEDHRHPATERYRHIDGEATSKPPLHSIRLRALLSIQHDLADLNSGLNVRVVRDVGDDLGHVLVEHRLHCFGGFEEQMARHTEPRRRPGPARSPCSLQ